MQVHATYEQTECSNVQKLYGTIQEDTKTITLFLALVTLVKVVLNNVEPDKFVKQTTAPRNYHSR